MKSILMTTVYLALALAAQAQTFSSGSTGADGALDLTSGGREVQLPESGVLNYTTVNIPAGRDLNFKRNSRNTPVILLAQDEVVINGNINIFGEGQSAGPGGFNGGHTNQDGLGPGGGTSGDPNGKWVGALSLVPITGGSGGFGRPCGYVGYRGVGGGGGGAIVIASSKSITITGLINANGAPNDGCGSSLGGGGAIRLVANAITVTGNLSGAAVVRLEAPQGKINYTGIGTPPVLASINPRIVPDSSTPSLRIVSIGGYPVPAYFGIT